MSRGRPGFFTRFIRQIVSVLSFQNGFNWKSVLHPNTCMTGQCERTAASYAINMRQTDPCQNYYEFACGNYRSINPIPNYYNAISAVDQRLHDINTKVGEHLQGKVANRAPVFQRIQTFYQSCMNEVAIQQRGLKTLEAELNLVDLHLIPPFGTDVKWGYKYMRTLAKIHRYSGTAPFLFDVSVQVDPKEMRVNHIFFGNTPAPSQAFMHSGFEGAYNFAKFTNVFNAETESDAIRYAAIRGALKMYITKVVTLMFRETKQQLTSIMQQIIPQRIEDVTNFLLELEKTRKTGKYNRVETIFRTTVDGIQREANLMDNLGKVQIEWVDYFSTLFAGLGSTANGFFSKQNPTILIQNTKQFKAVLDIVTRTKPEVLAMWWVVVQSLIPDGPRGLQEMREEYLRTVYKIEPMPRQLICINLVRTNFGFFVGYVLSKERRSKNNRLKVIDMVNYIKDSLHETIEKFQWMDPNTKALAITKLKRVTAYISYWDTLTDPAALDRLYGHTVETFPSFHDTYSKMLRQRRAANLSTLYTSNNLSNKMYPNSSSPFPRYFPSFVHLTVPIGALGFPFYDLGLEALNYGALASLIGHELWHALDTSGRNFDQHGDGWYWWSTWSVSEYDKREQEFSKFFRNVDSVYTAMENVADLVGFEVGLRAYQKYIERNGKERKLVKFKQLSHEKLFTIAFANMYCSNATPDFIYGQITEDENPPQEIRVNGIFMNSKEFLRIWDCQKNMPINVEPKFSIIP